MQKYTDGFYQSSFLVTVPSLVHAFSGRGMGDMKKDVTARKRFLAAVGIEVNVATPEQIHGAVVSSPDTPKGSDGFVGRSTIGIFTADCVPILAVDPQAQIVAAVHAGWKGTLLGIVGNMMETMKRQGVSEQRVLISFGPRIGACCYTVAEDRARLFLDQFKDEKVAPYFEGAWHIDLAYANFRVLVDAGVPPEHIDAPPMCTSCQVSEFFSYRKDSKETFGEMMGVIGWK